MKKFSAMLPCCCINARVFGSGVGSCAVPPTVGKEDPSIWSWSSVRNLLEIMHHRHQRMQVVRNYRYKAQTTRKIKYKRGTDVKARAVTHHTMLGFFSN